MKHNLDSRLRKLAAAAGPGGCTCPYVALTAAGDLPETCPRCGKAIVTPKKGYVGVSPDDWDV